MDPEFGNIDIFDDEESAGPSDRALRLEAARKASKEYQAKLDEPGVRVKASLLSLRSLDS